MQPQISDKANDVVLLTTFFFGTAKHYYKSQRIKGKQRPPRKRTPQNRQGKNKLLYHPLAGKQASAKQGKQKTLQKENKAAQKKQTRQTEKGKKKQRLTKAIRSPDHQITKKTKTEDNS